MEKHQFASSRTEPCFPNCSGAPSRILVVDHHPVVSRGLARVLRDEPDLELCGAARDSASALAAAKALVPDLIVQDLALGEQCGMDLLRQFVRHLPGQRTLVFSMRDEAVYAPQALRAGACGYITKHASPAELLQAIRQVLGGGIYVSRAVETAVLQRVVRRTDALDPLPALSARELAVFQLIASGKDSREIADWLGVSLRTIDSHRTRIKHKLHLRNGTELVQLAFRIAQGQDSGSDIPAGSTNGGARPD